MKNSPEVKFHEIVIPNPLWEFLTFCEIYCSAACCEDNAFEQHHSLIRRKIINFNLASKSGDAIFKEAEKQLAVVYSQIGNIKPDTKDDQLLVWCGDKSGLHEFQLNFDICENWFSNWVTVFNEINNPK